MAVTNCPRVISSSSFKRQLSLESFVVVNSENFNNWKVGLKNKKNTHHFSLSILIFMLSTIPDWKVGLRYHRT